MKIGRTELNGFEDDLPIEYPAIEDLSDWGDIGFLAEIVPTPEMLKSQMTAAGTAAAAMIGMSFIAPRLPVNPWLKIGGTAALGIIGGNLLSKQNRDAGIGLAAGLTGLALAQVVSKLLKRPLGLEAFDESEADVRRELTSIEVLPEEAQLRALPELDQVNVETEQKLHGFGQAVGVETERKFGGMDEWDEAVGVETEKKFGWLGV